MRITRNGLRALVGSCSLAMVFALSAPTMGQLSSRILDASQPLTADQRAEVEAFAEAQVESLAERDPRASTEARRRLVSPLTQRSSSRTFRLVYDDVLTPRLIALIEDGERPIHARVAALHLLGAIASDRSTAALQDFLVADQEAIRYAAAIAAQRAFARIIEGEAMLSNNRQRELDLARWLKAAISSERNDLPLHAQFAALGASSNATDAVEYLSGGLQDQLRDVYDGGPDARIARFQDALQRSLNQYLQLKLEGAPNLANLEKLMIQTAVMSLVLAIDDATEESDLTPRQRTAYAELARTAESVLVVVTGQTESTTGISQAFSSSDYAQANTVLASRWLDSSGPILRQSSWGFAAGDFEESRLFP
ncbi:MAG: hypothetical protein ACF8PN_15465 [Phycisphaerales bacterium]